MMQHDVSTALLRLRPRPGGGLAASGDPRAPRWRGVRAPRASTGGRLVYAVGDVHGRLDLLQALLGRIEADAAGRPRLLVFSGDYTDRGPDSAGVLDRLVRLRREFGDGVCLLKGNHELALLRFLDEPTCGGLWLDRFGGAATLTSYGVTPPDATAPPEAMAAARDALLDAMPASHLSLLQGLDLMAVLGDYAFVHAGVAPDAPLAEQTEEDLLWASRGFLTAERFEKIVVHGHTWAADRPELLDHRIGVDTGAYETGVLTAVAIQDGRRRVLQALDAEAEARRAAEAPAPRPLVVRPADYVRLPEADRAAMFRTPALSSTEAVA
jgi:serine/threonine protein phosphatase 1